MYIGFRGLGFGTSVGCRGFAFTVFIRFRVLGLWIYDDLCIFGCVPA